MRRLMIRVVACCAVAVALAQPAQAGYTTYNFQAVPSNINNQTNSNNAINQLSIQVHDDAGAGYARFRFVNTGNTAMALTDIWFDDGTLLGIVQPGGIQGSADGNGDGHAVEFTAGANPSTPSGSHGSNGNQNDPNKFYWNTSTGAQFSADSESPHLRQKGVNPGEWLDITFQLQSSTMTYQTVLDALNLSLNAQGNSKNLKDIEGGLRIAIHVQGLANNGSETLVNGGPVNTVPAPAGLILLLSCAPFALAGRVIRRKLTAKAA